MPRWMQKPSYVDDIFSLLLTYILLFLLLLFPLILLFFPSNLGF